MPRKDVSTELLRRRVHRLESTIKGLQALVASYIKGADEVQSLNELTMESKLALDALREFSHSPEKFF